MSENGLLEGLQISFGLSSLFWWGRQLVLALPSPPLFKALRSLQVSINVSHFCGALKMPVQAWTIPTREERREGSYSLGHGGNEGLPWPYSQCLPSPHCKRGLTWQPCLLFNYSQTSSPFIYFIWRNESIDPSAWSLQLPFGATNPNHESSSHLWKPRRGANSHEEVQHNEIVEQSTHDQRHCWS